MKKILCAFLTTIFLSTSSISHAANPAYLAFPLGVAIELMGGIGIAANLIQEPKEEHMKGAFWGAIALLTFASAKAITYGSAVWVTKLKQDFGPILPGLWFLTLGSSVSAFVSNGYLYASEGTKEKIDTALKWGAASLGGGLVSGVALVFLK